MVGMSSGFDPGITGAVLVAVMAPMVLPVLFLLAWSGFERRLRLRLCAASLTQLSVPCIAFFGALAASSTAAPAILGCVAAGGAQIMTYRLISGARFRQNSSDVTDSGDFNA